MNDEGKPTGVTATEHRLETLRIRSIDGVKTSYRSFLQELTRYLRSRLRKRIRVRDDDVEDLVQEFCSRCTKGSTCSKLTYL
jgi:DNA-directed RNA polymerase specialized sigma24 family protein